MFTGIIESMGTVRRTHARDGGLRLFIDVGELAAGMKPGDSLAVNGVCLTLTTSRGGLAKFDAVGETLARSTLAELRPGEQVNLERPMALGDRLHGHLVQGHVDGRAVLARREQAGAQWALHFTADEDLTRQMVPKGSVALDGVSLTLIDVAEGRFHVAIIPETARRTRLGSLRVGQSVNVEVDVLGKYVRRHLAAYLQRPPSGSVTRDFLVEHGFV